jgi:hypothetical protein
MPSSTAAADANALRTHLQALKRLRGSEAKTAERLQELKHWQSARLRRTYADLAALPRYRHATTFFLADLYAPKDFSDRDQEMLRILPVMTRVLPTRAVETAALAVELEALSEALDRRLVAALPQGALDEEAYGAAYRASATREERARQIDLIVQVGRRLDALVARPMIFSTLKLMRQPARVAGMADLQEFLERGFEAFREMGGAEEFLAVIRQRETQILNRLFSSAPEPFSV